jgi:erythronate-4-phosphate dehydrogenase
MPDKVIDQVIAEAILASYDVKDDDRRFRKDPSEFEELRNNYPVRREFEAFTVQSAKQVHDIINKLKDLGFVITAKS